MLNYIELSKDYSIEEIMIPPKMANKNLRDLDLRAKYNVSVIAIVRGVDIIISPSPEQLIEQEDILVMIGHRKDIAQFSNIE